MPESDPKESLSPAVNSAADILDLLADAGRPVGTSEIARRIGRAKSTVANIVSALEQTALIERSAAGGFHLGRKLVELSGAYLEQSDWVADFHKTCRLLPVAKEETLSLSSLKGTEIVYLAHHNGSQPVRWFANVGSRLPTVATAMGVALLSSLDEAQLDDVLASIEKYPLLTEYSYRSEAELRDVVAEAQENGYAVGDQLNTIGLCSLSRPVANRFDSRSFAVGVTLLSARLNPELQEALLTDLDELSNLLPPANEH